jgi:DNA-binding NarL/FixJ family response regulator
MDEHPRSQVRIVLADDAVLLREALRTPSGPPGSTSWAAGIPASWLVERAARSGHLDVRMPLTHTTEGLEAARQLRAASPGIAILILSQYVETRYAVDLLREDPSGIGYLLKDRVTRVADLAEAVRRLVAGGSVIDPEVVSRLLGRPRRHSPLDELTTRERQILELMAEGRSNQAIADRLGLELKTVEGHVRAIFSKLGLEPAAEDHRRVLAVLAYLRDWGRRGAHLPDVARPDGSWFGTSALMRICAYGDDPVHGRDHDLQPRSQDPASPAGGDHPSPGAGLCESGGCRELGASQPNISQHLSVLRAAGIVDTERDGREVRYSLADPEVMVACNVMRAVLQRRLTRLGRLSHLEQTTPELVEIQ